MQMMNKNGFSRCAEFYIGRLRKEGRHSTAHVYKNAIFSFSKFCGTSNVSFRQVTRERLRRYGQYLYECGLKPNTISTYMRMLRCIYNRGVEAGSARQCRYTLPLCASHVRFSVVRRLAELLGHEVRSEPVFAVSRSIPIPVRYPHSA